MALSMLALLSLLFCVGGSTLISASFKGSLEQEEASAPGDCLLRVLKGLAGNHDLMLSGAIETNGDSLCLTTSRCISELYAAREH